MKDGNRLDIRQEIPVKSFAVCAYVCRTQDGAGRYLLLRRNTAYLEGVWQPVTGRVEKGETAWQAALREIDEEAGIAPDALYSANLVEIFYETSQNCINLIPVFVGLLARPQEVRLSPEHCAYRWSADDEAKQLLLFEQQRRAVDHIEKRFIQRDPMEFLRIDSGK